MGLKCQIMSKSGDFLKRMRAESGFPRGRVDYLLHYGIAWSPDTLRNLEDGTTIPNAYHINHLIDRGLIKPDSEEHKTLLALCAFDREGKNDDENGGTDELLEEAYMRIEEIAKQLEECRKENKRLFLKLHEAQLAVTFFQTKIHTLKEIIQQVKIDVSGEVVKAMLKQGIDGADILQKVAEHDNLNILTPPEYHLFEMLAPPMGIIKLIKVFVDYELEVKYNQFTSIGSEEVNGSEPLDLSPEATEDRMYDS